MKTFTSALLLVLLLSTAAFLSAQSSTPAVGSHGFDWLQPQQAKCEWITEAMIQGFSECLYGEEYSFGLGIPAHACKAGEHSEYIILPEQDQCVDVLETMKANAP